MKKLGKHQYCSLPENIQRVPRSIRVLLESVLRNHDGKVFTDEHVNLLANWEANPNSRQEIPYMPARVILQDFTGVPAVVDLAAMRDAAKRLGSDPGSINPLVPCDLVIDHSVQVDFYGTPDALEKNEEIEFQRNHERYEFLKWGQSAFNNLRVVPPSTGIVHQVNLEFLSSVAFVNGENGTVYPDSCVGTDSHTPMVNGLGVLAWGVGGIEAEAVMLGQPIYMLVPDVIGIKIKGKLPEGATSTDLVLKVTEICREVGVVGKFVEFFGEGIANMSVADRATIGNMAPEQGATVSFFPVDEQTLKFLRTSGRTEEQVKLVEDYYKAQGLFVDNNSPDPEYTKVIEVNLSEVEPAVAGPKRPHDRVNLKDLGPTYESVLTSDVGPRGFGLSKDVINKKVNVKLAEKDVTLEHGSVLIAAITSCTNTSNPSVMVAAGLVAKKACEFGLNVKPFVKTSLAPGSRVVTEYLERSGLQPYFDKLGFHTVGYGCTTCIGNSGPLDDNIAEAVFQNDIVASAVLSGNRNFEGRINPHTRSNYLASPPLVVAYALFGSTAKDITTEPIGTSKDGTDIFLKDIWPEQSEIDKIVQETVNAKLFTEKYADVWKGSEQWKAIESTNSELYNWRAESTYIRKPPFFEAVTKDSEPIKSIENAAVIAAFGDSVTTDHISPAGQIAGDSPAAKYLNDMGIEKKDFNSYGSRRGNHEVMMRGTFANIRLRNELIPGSVGNKTLSDGNETTFFEAGELYQKSGRRTVVFAGKEYGSGSSRDWAAKGPYLQGIKAVIAKSYERIHRSNLIGMGILPLEADISTELVRDIKSVDIQLTDNLKPQSQIEVLLTLKDGTKKKVSAQSRIDTPVEVDYFRDGGILHHVLKNLARG